MQKKIFYNFFSKKIFFLLIFFISSCSSIPKNTSDVCAIFSEKYLWYKHAIKAEKKWDVPVYIQLAFIKKESAFNWLAKPKRLKLFKIIPYKRPSSSFGYSQAVVGTWEQYKNETGNKFATRVRFKDSTDFIGWYINKTNKINGIKKSDAYNQYLAYHEGHGGFKSKSYNNKNWLINTAIKVDQRAEKYRQQLDQCKSQFKKKIFGIF